ncbi:MAG: Holliday junction resolvase RecU [Clostridiales bacterium]|nr:Holliday junction resolvase RecU [Clostridiales bacterium]
MATWGTRGLRGSTLEEMINVSLEKYREKKLALIQKIPTPIKPIHMDKETGHITLAYFDQRSTVDYIGVVQGVPVCFDAKECASDTIPLQNIHEHQMVFMRDFEQQGGVAFFLLYLSQRDEAYYIPFRDALRFWNRAAEGGRKSFTYAELDQSYRIEGCRGISLHFLCQIQKDLEERSSSSLI